LHRKNGPTRRPGGIAINGPFIYWANSNTNSIARANLDGTNVNLNFVNLPSGTGAAGIAVDGTYIYFAEEFANSIGRVNLDGCAFRKLNSCRKR